MKCDKCSNEMNRLNLIDTMDTWCCLPCMVYKVTPIPYPIHVDVKIDTSEPLRSDGPIKACGEVTYGDGRSEGSHPCALHKDHDSRHECEGSCCWWTLTVPKKEDWKARAERLRDRAEAINRERIDALARAEKAERERDDLKATDGWETAGLAATERDGWGMRAKALESQTCPGCGRGFAVHLCPPLPTHEQKAVLQDLRDMERKGIVPVIHADPKSAIGGMHALDHAYRYLCGLYMQDHPVSVQREHLSVISAIRKALGDKE